MKSDLKINFSVIQEIAESINTYKKALETMQEALNSINGRLESENSGQAVTALIDRHEELQNDINTCKEELESLHKLFNGFYQDMTGIIHPVNYGAEVRVDRLDIYFNMQTIFRSIDVVKTQWTYSQYTPVYNTSSSYTNGNGSGSEDEAQKIKEENNYRKMEDIWDIIKSYGNRLEDNKEEMEFLFNRYVVPYEEMDNQYGDSANKLYAQKATVWDRVKDFGEGVYNLGVGVVDLGIDLLKFPFALGGGILQYGMGGTGYLISKVTGDTPGFFDYTEDKFHETNKKVKSVFNNPWEAVEDVAQQTSDDYEEKGLMHTIGYYGMGYLTTKVRFKSITANAAEVLKVENAALNHSILGDFTYNPKTTKISKMKGGGHGQANIEFLEANGLEYEITKTYANGVRVGNVPGHKTKAKRTGGNQSWFPKGWSESDIAKAGEYVANLKENINAIDGIVSYGEVNGVRVGVIKTNGQIGTIFPDAVKQP